MSDIKKIIFNIKKTKSYIDFNNYHSNNILNLTKVARNEHVHSNFIAWFLDMHSGHGLGSFPIEQFIKSLEFIKSKEENVNSRINLDNISKFYNDKFVTDVKITREDKNIDILVLVFTKEKILPIIIENKVNSAENGYKIDEKGKILKQTETYFNLCEEKYKNRDKYYEPIYIYLCPIYNDSNPKKQEYLRMTYQDLVDYVIDPSYYKCDIGIVKNNIKTYLQCLSYSNENERGDNTMAISSEEKKIIREFWQENRDLIILALNESKDESNKEEIEEAINTVSGLSYRYRFDNKEYNSQNRLVLAVVKKYCIDHPKVTFEKLSLAFTDDIASRSYGVVKLKNELIKKFSSGRKDNYYDRYFAKDNEIITLSNGDVVLVSNQWSWHYTNNFIEKARSLGYEIEEI